MRLKDLVRWVLSWLTVHATLLLGKPLFWFGGLCPKKPGISFLQLNRILLVRLDEIGDVLMTTPVLRELRRNSPNAWITLLVTPGVYNLVELCPYVDEILTFDCRLPRYFGWRFARYFAGTLHLHWHALRLAYHHLWQRQFDLAIVPRWDVDNYHASFVAYLSGAAWRMGYSENVTYNKRRFNYCFDRLFTHVLEDDTLKHEVEHNLDVIRFLGGAVQDVRLELWVGLQDRKFAEDVFESYGIDSASLLIAFGPGAAEQKRMWPLDNFIELADWLNGEYHARILAVGGPGEQVVGQVLQRQLGEGVINMVGQTTLRQTVVLLKRCLFFVGNDSGPMHLAAAVGLPIIEISCHPRGGALLNSNSPRRFGPWGVPHAVLQPETALHPCSDGCISDQPHCISALTVEHVKEAVVAQFSQQRRPNCSARGIEI